MRDDKYQLQPSQGLVLRVGRATNLCTAFCSRKNSQSKHSAAYKRDTTTARVAHEGHVGSNGGVQHNGAVASVQALKNDFELFICERSLLLPTSCTLALRDYIDSVEKRRKLGG